jgi:hypothetical protein
MGKRSCEEIGLESVEHQRRGTPFQACLFSFEGLTVISAAQSYRIFGANPLQSKTIAARGVQTAPALQRRLKNLPYDTLKDFIPVAPLTSQPYLA